MRQTTPKKPAFLRIDLSAGFEICGRTFGRRWEETDVLGIPYVTLNADAPDKEEIYRFDKQGFSVVVTLCSSPVCE